MSYPGPASVNVITTLALPIALPFFHRGGLILGAGRSLDRGAIVGANAAWRPASMTLAVICPRITASRAPDGALEFPTLSPRHPDHIRPGRGGRGASVMSDKYCRHSSTRTATMNFNDDDDLTDDEANVMAHRARAKAELDQIARQTKQALVEAGIDIGVFFLIPLECDHYLRLPWLAIPATVSGAGWPKSSSQSCGSRSGWIARDAGRWCGLLPRIRNAAMRRTRDHRHARRLPADRIPHRQGDRRIVVVGRQHPAQRRRMLTSSAGSVAGPDVRARLLPDFCPTWMPDLKSSHSLGCPTCPTYYQIERPLLLPVKGEDWATSPPASFATLARKLVGQVGQVGQLNWKSMGDRQPSRAAGRAAPDLPSLDQSASPSSNAPLTT